MLTQNNLPASSLAAVDGKVELADVEDATLKAHFPTDLAQFSSDLGPEMLTFALVLVRTSNTPRELVSVDLKFSELASGGSKLVRSLEMIKGIPVKNR